MQPRRASESGLLPNGRRSALGPGELRRLTSAGTVIGTQLVAGQLSQSKERWRASPTPGARGQGRFGSAAGTKPPFQPGRQFIGIRGRDRPLTAAPPHSAYPRGAFGATAVADQIAGTLRTAAAAIEPRELREPAATEVSKPQHQPPQSAEALQTQSARPSSARSVGKHVAEAKPEPTEQELSRTQAPKPAPAPSTSQAAPPAAPAVPMPPATHLHAAAPPAGMHEPVAIHICDEPRGIKQDFYCDLPLLLRHMRYFEAYLSGVSRADELDISVHCDVYVFAWLMEYVSAVGHAHDIAACRSAGVGPALEVANCVSILISSEFLQMGPLVTECERFAVRHASEIALLPIDLSCILDATIKRCGVQSGRAAGEGASREHVR